MPLCTLTTATSPTRPVARSRIADAHSPPPGARARSLLFSWAETARKTVAVYRSVLAHMSRVSAVVVSHGQRAGARASRCRPLRPQVDELVRDRERAWLGPVGGRRRSRTTTRCGYSANLNKGIALTTGDAVVAANPDAVPLPGAVAALAEFMAANPRCGVAGPMMVYPDGSWQPSRRRFPTVTGTVVRRTPLRKVVPQRHHFHQDESPPTEPVQSDWMLGGFLLLRRTMLEELGGFDEGFRRSTARTSTCSTPRARGRVGSPGTSPPQLSGTESTRR